MEPTNKYEPPEATGKDHLHTLARAGIGSIPTVGAAATELFQMIIMPSLEKRKVVWMNEVAEGLRKLEEGNHLRLEDLAHNEVFIDIVLQASSAAMRTSRKEKREALRNAVLNSALPNAPDESRQQMFLQLVDTLTVWHLQILKLFANPRQWFKEQGRPCPKDGSQSGRDSLLFFAYPELKNQRNLCDQAVRELNYHGLFPTDNINVMTTGRDTLNNFSTEWGEQFFAFITAPPDPNIIADA
ncbi:MAG: hypothetical protein JXM70_07995 [Pirellulales bacterium]|nr:hypothetical protein [Pirellulales bacterium]